MYIALLILTTFIWGFGFVGTRWTFEIYDPYWSHAWRFIIAGLLVSPYVYMKRKEIHWKPAIVISIVLFLGLLFQTIGIKYTSLAKSGFLTAFYAIFTPLFLGVLYKRKFSLLYWALVILAMFGMVFLCEFKIENFNYGDFFILLSAVLFSVHIILIEKYANDFNPLVLNGVQCLIMGLLGTLTAFYISGPSSPDYFLPGSTSFSQTVFLGFVVLSLFSSLIAFSIQILVQKHIQAHIVGVIFLMEAIFASLFGYLFFQEQLGFLQIIGSIIICIALVALNSLVKEKKIIK